MSAKAREIASAWGASAQSRTSFPGRADLEKRIASALSAARAEGLREARLMRHEERDGLCLYCGRMNATGTLWAQVCTSRLEAAIRALAEEGKSPETPDGCPSKAGKCSTCGGSGIVGAWTCKVCGNAPDGEGVVEHGRGCYVVSADGGGMSFVDEGERGEPCPSCAPKGAGS